MIGWLRRGASAAAVAGDRGDLWPAGALGTLAFLGWLPLLLAVSPLDGSDLQALGVALYTSSAYPANVVALSVAAVSGFMLLCLLAAFAEVALSAAAAPRRGAGRGPGELTMSGLAIVLLATVPALLVTGALVAGVAAHAAAEFTSPDVETPVVLRLAGTVAPQLVALLLAVLVGQVLGGLALRETLASGAATAGLRRTWSRMQGGPWGAIGAGTVGWVLDVAYLVVSYALLRILWAPVAADLQAGLLAAPSTLVLLVGFVAIWLVLLMVGGALHVAISAWWALELSAMRDDLRREAKVIPHAEPQGGARR